MRERAAPALAGAAEPGGGHARWAKDAVAEQAERASDLVLTWPAG